MLVEPMRTTVFANGEFFHIYNRGVDKRTVFTEKKEYERFSRSLYEFNDENHRFGYSTLSEPRINHASERIQHVRIVCYCLMPNHYHLLLEQLRVGGVSRFMHKLGNGYTKYFNLRHQRSGALFESTYKAKHVPTTDYLVHLSRYIHLNPLEINVKADYPLSNLSALNNQLLSYPWSSYQQYLSPKMNDDLVDSTKVMENFSSPEEYKKFVLNWTLNKHPIFRASLDTECRDSVSRLRTR